MSPMCWLMKASRPAARQNVFFSSPPTASVGPAGEREPEREGGVAPGTPQRQLLPLSRVDLEHRVVARDVDRAVVQQPGVGDGTQPSPGVVIVVADRLVGQVAARHHQHVGHRGPGRRPRGPERRGDGAAACRGAARPAAGCPAPPAPRWPMRRVRAPAHEDDGPLRRGQEPASAASMRASVRAARRSRAMTANGFSTALLARPEPLHRRVGACVAGQVVPAEALDGDDLPAGERRLGAAMAASEPTTDRTRAGSSSHRRGPQSAQATGWAWKRRSAGSWYSAAQASHRANPRMVVLRPVVGEAQRDGEARAAVGAVGERIARPAVGGVEQLGEAVVTGRDVGRHEGPDAAVAAGSRRW